MQKAGRSDRPFCVLRLDMRRSVLFGFGHVPRDRSPFYDLGMDEGRVGLGRHRLRLDPFAIEMRLHRRTRQHVDHLVIDAGGDVLEMDGRRLGMVRVTTLILPARACATAPLPRPLARVPARRPWGERPSAARPVRVVI
jgi:hypothetical protein